MSSFYKKKRGNKIKSKISFFMFNSFRRSHPDCFVKSVENMTVIGETLDDAEGLINLQNFRKPYPGGPLIDKYGKLDKLKFTFGKIKLVI